MSINHLLSVNHLAIPEKWKEWENATKEHQWSGTYYRSDAVCKLVKVGGHVDLQEDYKEGYNKEHVVCTPEHIAWLITIHEEKDNGISKQVICPECEKSDLYQDNVPLLVLGKAF